MGLETLPADQHKLPKTPLSLVVVTLKTLALLGWKVTASGSRDAVQLNAYISCEIETKKSTKDDRTCP